MEAHAGTPFVPAFWRAASIQWTEVDHDATHYGKTLNTCIQNTEQDQHVHYTFVI